jgi:hypothetical protein
MTTIELKNYTEWKVDLDYAAEVQNTYGYDYHYTYNFRRNGEHMFHFRSLEELHPAQLERIAICYINGEIAGRREQATAFQKQIHITIDNLGLRPFLIAVLRDLMGPG